MLENINIVTIVMLIAFTLAIATNFLNLRDRFFKWYRTKIRKYQPINSQKSEKLIKILNFGHPLTKEQIEKIQQLLNVPVDDVIQIPTTMDESQAFRPQLCDLISAAKISSESLQRGEYIINLPGFAPASAVLIAELHGRMGHFPTIIRLKKVEGSLPPSFNVEEIINLQAIRDEGRGCR